jgi:hypothetical protein
MSLRFLVVSFFMFTASALIGLGIFWGKQTLEPGSPSEPRNLVLANTSGETYTIKNLYGLAVREAGMYQIEYWLAEKGWLGHVPLPADTSGDLSRQELDEDANVARSHAWFAAHAVVGLPEPTRQWSINNMIVENVDCDVSENFFGVKKYDYEPVLGTSLRPSLFKTKKPVWAPKVLEEWGKGYFLEKPGCQFSTGEFASFEPILVEDTLPGAAGQWLPLYSPQNDPPVATNIPTWKGGSIGLIYGLAYVDYLTPGEELIPAEISVAATGSLGVSPTGWSKVFEVRSVKEKTLSASWVDADIIFVPHGQKYEAHSSVLHKIIEVKSLEEAVGWLCILGSQNSVCDRFPHPRSDVSIIEEYKEYIKLSEKRHKQKFRANK